MGTLSAANRPYKAPSMPDQDLPGGKKLRLVYLVARVFHALRATRLEPALKKAGITPLQFTIMTVVERHPGLSSAELSRRFYVSAQTMGQVLGNLENRGLLDRREDVDNRRILRVSLTDKGARLVRECDAYMDIIESEIFGDDSPENETLRVRLLQIAAHLRKASMPVTAPTDPRKRKHP